MLNKKGRSKWVKRVNTSSPQQRKLSFSGREEKRFDTHATGETQQ